jgi:hypothetical protein
MKKMEHIPTEKEIKEKYNLDDAGFKKAVMNLVALEVLEKHNANSVTKAKNASKKTSKKIIEDFMYEWQETKKAFGWD